MRSLVAFTVALLLPLAAAAAEGWYTADQASKGELLFNNLCAECHRPDLTGAMGPALKGDAFLSKWENQPLSNLFWFEHTKMPAVNPGSVPDDEMYAITAYILSKNGFKAGDAPLDKDNASRVLKP